VDEEKKERVLIADANSFQGMLGLNNTDLMMAEHDRVIITEGVRKDIYDDSYRPRKEVVELISNPPSWFEVRRIEIPDQHIKKDRGERESIALADQMREEGHSVTFLTDDTKKRDNARDQAESQGIKVTTSLGLIERADELGMMQGTFKEERSRLSKVGLTPSHERIEASDARHAERERAIQQFTTNMKEVHSADPERREFAAPLPTGREGHLSAKGLERNEDVKRLVTYDAIQRLEAKKDNEKLNVVIREDRHIEQQRDLSRER